MRKFVMSALGFLTAATAWGCSAETANGEGDEAIESSEEAIVGGTQTPADMAEASAALLSANGRADCGGVVIARRWVLTAAHCVEFDNDGNVTKPTHVKVGTKNLNQGGQKIKVAHAIAHEDWNDDTFANDIAVIELEEPALVKPARLMNAMDNGALPFGAPLTAVGWGSTNADGSGSATVQRRVDLPMLEHNVCYHMGASNITLWQLCAGGQVGKDTCLGDSGGPAYATINGERLVAGIVSFGIVKECGTNKPAVYTRVSAYTDWINDNVMDNSSVWQFPPNTVFPVTEQNPTPVKKTAFRSAAYQVLAGQFNDDKLADQILYQPGTGKEWLYVGGSNSAIELTRKVNGNDELTVRLDYEPIVGDFDGNGRSDVYWYGRGSQPDMIWWFDTTGAAANKIATNTYLVKSTQVSLNGAAASTGQNGNFSSLFASKLDSDQRADIGWYEPGQTGFTLWYAEARSGNIAKFTTKTVSNVLPTNKLVPLPGKYNGDAYGDIFWYGPGATVVQDFMLQGSSSRGTFTKVTSTSDTSAEETDYTVDGTLYQPFTGDFDGNGYTDIYWYEPGDLWNDPGNNTSKQDAIWWFQGTGGYDEVIEPQTGYATPVVGDFSGPESNKSTDDILWFEGARARGEKI